jgi:hypothetical protein
MDKYKIDEIGGAYGEGTDTYGVVDEHFSVRHSSGIRVRTSQSSMTVQSTEVLELREMVDRGRTDP